MSSEKFTRGMNVRREVLGDEYVDRALSSASAFSKPLQDLLTENCWGEVWADDALPRRTRSLVTIAILTTVRAPMELKAHVLGALRNGCSVDEIQGVLLHCAVYCGAPAAIEAFRAANEVIGEWQKSNGNG
jgi:4-carboxymuconolactone decarboxylase